MLDAELSPLGMVGPTDISQEVGTHHVIYNSDNEGLTRVTELHLTFCLTSTEARMLIRDGGGGGGRTRE